MAYRIAGIDVHKKKLAVVVADVEVDDEYQFERRWFGSNPEQLQRLVMESTAQYWKPLWSALEWRNGSWSSGSRKCAKPPNIFSIVVAFLGQRSILISTSHHCSPPIRLDAVPGKESMGIVRFEMQPSGEWSLFGN
jgi:hypothetical protein